MARNLNRVTLLGNITATPELNHTASGTAVINFSLATNESYKDADGEWVEKPQFHNLVAWGKQAELVAQLVTKGQQMVVEGSINYGSYQHKEYPDVTMRTTEIKVQNFILTGGRPTSDTTVETPEAVAADYLDPDDDLPF